MTLPTAPPSNRWRSGLRSWGRSPSGRPVPYLWRGQFPHEAAILAEKECLFGWNLRPLHHGMPGYAAPTHTACKRSRAGLSQVYPGGKNRAGAEPEPCPAGTGKNPGDLRNISIQDPEDALPDQMPSSYPPQVRGCFAYVQRFFTQRMPEGMDAKEWNHRKLTEAKVMAYLATHCPSRW